MNTSPNYGFNLPGSSDPAAIGPVSENFSAIDTILAEQEGEIHDSVKFGTLTAAPTRTTEGTPGRMYRFDDLHAEGDESHFVYIYLCVARMRDYNLDEHYYVWHLICSYHVAPRENYIDEE